MSQIPAEILNDLIEFYNQFADELDACHPEAFDLIYDLIHHNLLLDEMKRRLSDFEIEYGDELEGCNEEAFTNLQTILHNLNIN